MEVNPATAWSINYTAFFGPIPAASQKAWLEVWSANLKGDPLTAEEINTAVARICSNVKAFRTKPTCENIFWEIFNGRSGDLRPDEIAQTNEALSICRSELRELPPGDRWYRICDFTHELERRHLPDSATEHFENFCRGIPGGLPCPKNNWDGDPALQQRAWNIAHRFRGALATAAGADDTVAVRFNPAP